MRSILRRGIGAVLAVVALAFVACDFPTGLRSGKVSLLLTDAPGDIVTAVVTIDQIYLQGSDTDDAPRVILRNVPFTTDLLTLADSLHPMLEEVEIPAGTYRQLRFVISGGYIEVEGEGGATTIYASSPTYAGLPAGATVGGSLQMPSFAQSGLKVNLPGDAVQVVADDLVVIVVDFDVSQSFGQAAGASGMWVMHPVLQGSVTQ